jgi:membrane protein
LILVLAVISTIGDRRLEEGFITFAGAVLTPNTGGVLMRELERAGTQTGVSVAGVVVLLWGTLRIFRGLDRAFSDIYETEAHNSVADQVADGTLVLLTFCLALVAGWGMNAVLSRYGPGLLVGATRQVVLVFGLAITFFPAYYVSRHGRYGAGSPLGRVRRRDRFDGVRGCLPAVRGVQIARIERRHGHLDLAHVAVLQRPGRVTRRGLQRRPLESEPGRQHRAGDRRDFPPDRAEEVAERCEHLLASLQELDANLAAGTGIDIAGDDGEAHLPPPRRVEIDDGTASAIPGDGVVSLAIEWDPRETAKTDDAAKSVQMG